MEAEGQNPRGTPKKSRKRAHKSTTDEGPTLEKETNPAESSKLLDPFQVKRPFTLSVAVAGTVIDNASTPQLKALLCGQIARAVAIFNVDEIIVFNDKSPKPSPGSDQLALILQYLECPQYLRKHLFPLERDLSNAGLIAPLSLPHHFSKADTTAYRDGVVTKEDGKCDWVEVGLRKKVNIDMRLEEGLRVTVKLDNPYDVISKSEEITGTVVSPSEPKEELGIYWGYTVRKVSCMDEVLDSPVYEDGYDMIIGTSDKGTNITEMEKLKNSFKHMLVIFGGVDGLETVTTMDYDDDEGFLNYFHHYINVRPSQGTRTIRTEEAIPITLTALGPLIKNTFESNSK